jgi:hypothetical protein
VLREGRDEEKDKVVPGMPRHFLPRHDVFCYAVLLLAALLGFAAGAAGPGEESIQISPPYEVRVRLEFSSPFVADGRLSLAEFALEAVFAEVRFEFDPKEDPLLGRCQVKSQPGKGKFARLILNDVQAGEERLPAMFTAARPAEFPAKLDIESEPMEDEETTSVSPDPPEKVRFSFWTEFGPEAVKWGSKSGAAALEDFQVVFEAPFRQLLQGKGGVVTFPYAGRYPEDKGAWTVEFIR